MRIKNKKLTKTSSILIRIKKKKLTKKQKRYLLIRIKNK